MRLASKPPLAVVLALAAGIALAPGAEARSSRVPAEDGVGARNFYFCAALQAVKVVGLFTANVPLVVGGAIGGGIACGMGW